MRRFLRSLRARETGQTMIFFAVLTPALFATAGMAIEGGRVFVEYRRVQAAADMAALIGAQALPCAIADATCISTAQTQACTYATSNGFSGCTAGGTSASKATANVPPLSCSPYDFMDYGNGSGNSSCKSTTAPTLYSYVEVKLSDNLGTVPIFNTPVTLSAHAVAKHGPRTSGDFAIMTLDPNNPLTIAGNGSVVVTGSVFGQGGVSGNSKTDATCDGGWYAAFGTISGVTTDTTGTPTFSPPGCGGSNDTTPVTQAQFPQQSDPYGGGSPPPGQGGSYPGCTECIQTGQWYTLPNGPWHKGTESVSGDAELFPGIYSDLSLKNGNQIYFNPGVYTFTNGYDTQHGAMCVYGAPDCMDGNQLLSNNGGCAQNPFGNATAAADWWYSECSPYGFWDAFRAKSAPNGSLAMPTFTDLTTPLNGVTIYLPSTSPGMPKVNGNGGGDVFLAAPNPCPGTGTTSSGALPGVSMPAGSASGVFTYASAYKTANDNLPDGGVSSSVAGSVYPNYDFSLLAECNSTNLVWPGEMLKPQHLHFLIYDASNSAGQKINGASSQNWTGIIYVPNTSITVLGAGKGAGGPPWINGQLITFNADFSGNSYNDVSYRPCAPGSNSCGSGVGTQLVQ